MIQFSTNTNISKGKYGEFVNVAFKHLYRLPHQYHKNKDIDPTRTPDNQTYVPYDKVLVKRYQREIKRKDQAFCFCITTIIKTDEPFLNNERLEQVKMEYIDFIKEQFPNHQVLGCICHNDERNPNIHIQISTFNDVTRKGDANVLFDKSFFKEFKSKEQEFIKDLKERNLIDSCDNYHSKKFRQLIGRVTSIEEYKSRIDKLERIYSSLKGVDKDKVDIEDWIKKINDVFNYLKELANSNNVNIQNQKLKELKDTLNSGFENYAEIINNKIAKLDNVVDTAIDLYNKLVKVSNELNNQIKDTNKTNNKGMNR